MAQPHKDLKHLSGLGNYTIGDTDAWESFACPHCDAGRLIRVTRQVDSGTDGTSAAATRWLRCPACMKGALIQDGTLYPETKPMRVPAGLPKIDEAIWAEVRKCLGAGAHTAAVMLCRKLLFHVAVAHKMAAKKDNGWAPTFKEAVDYLEDEGIITKRMRPWVDRIKDVGNDATHELTPISKEEADDVAAFTEQLLELAYEMDEKMKAAKPPAEDEPDEDAEE